MGFQNTAQNLASYGRGNDTQLVHMSPNEIRGLQAIALAHGGSLTINPTTGLPEAGFLERILPMVAGAGLAMIPGVGPLAAAAMVGGGYGIATGSMEKGLMAGLSAYGGAGLATGLAGAGASAAVEAGGQAAVEQAGATAGEEAITQVGASGAGATGAGATGTAAPVGDVFAGYSPTGSAAGTAGTTVGTGTAGSGAASAAQNAINAQTMPNLSADQISSLRADVLKAENPIDIVRSAHMGNVAQSPQIANPTFSQSMSNAGRGLGQLGSQQGLSSVYASMPTGTLPATAITMMSPDQPKGPAGYQEDEYDRRLKGYRLSPNYRAYEAPTPNPYYRPTYAAEGGVMESFDDEAGVDMASGGIARYRNKGEVNVLQDYLNRQEREEAQKQRPLSTNPASYFPDVGIFRDTDVDTARKDALTAAMIRLGKAGKGAGIKAVPLPKTSIRGLGDIRGATPEVEEAAKGGVMSHLGGYSDGGRMLKGPGDGMSDSIPATISGKQPARLADGEFVVPADVVSHLGNGSTDAGAKKLYSMMDKIRKARTGKKKQAPAINPEKYLPGNKKASGGIAGYAEGGAVGYAEGGMTDSAVASYIQSSLDSGKGGAEIGAGLIAAGVPQSQVVAATGLSADVVAQAYAGGAALGGGGANVTSGGGGAAPASNVVSSPVSSVPDSVIKASVIDMMNSGVGGAEIARAFAAMGVSQEQAVRATGLDANTIAQAYAGGASLPAISSAANLPPRLPVDASGKTIYPTVSDIKVASFLRDNQLTTPEQQAAAFKMYNIQPNQQAAALALLASKDKAVIDSLNAATKEYQDAIRANPNLAIQNAYTTYNAAQDVGLKPIIPPIIPKTPTTPTTPTTTGPTSPSVYRPGFVPRISGINMSDAIKDPYSNAGLEALYNQMMGQYAKPAPRMTDAEVKAMVQRLVNEKVGGAEIGQRAINAGIPVNQAITATGLSPDIVNQAYIGGQSLGTTPPPTLDTQYNYIDPATYYRPPSPDNLVLSRPIIDAAFQAIAPEPAPAPAPAPTPTGDSGGGG